MVNKDKTGSDRQSRLRQMRKQFIKSYGFNSAEGIVGALVRGEKLLIDVKQFVEIIEDLDGLEFCCFCKEHHTRHDLGCPVFSLTKIIPTVKSVPTPRAPDASLGVWLHCMTCGQWHREKESCIPANRERR